MILGDIVTIVLPPATLARLFWLGLFLSTCTGVAACGKEARMQGMSPPTSPVGRYKGKFYRYDGQTAKSDGTSESRISTTHDVTIEVRADHTFTYDWKSLAGANGEDGGLAGTWREDAHSGRWLLLATGSSTAERDVFPVGDVILQADSAPPVDLRDRRPVPAGQWAFPHPDLATGQLRDNYMFVTIQ